MKLNELTYAEGAKTKPYRNGRGVGSGNGKNAKPYGRRSYRALESVEEAS